MKVLIKKLLPESFRLRIQPFYYRFRSLFYIGNRFECPLCGGRFRRFLPFGVVKRKENAVCPRCASHGRHRLLWLFLENKTDLFRERRKLLYFAPMAVVQGRLSRMSNIGYKSADIASPLAMEKMDITDIPEQDSSYDCIICSHVLEHVEQDRKAMAELYRVLRPGGWAITTTPVEMDRERTYENPEVVRPADREREFGHPEHVRIYGRDYVDRLESVGFTVSIEQYARELPPDLIAKYSIGLGETIHLCRRPA